MAKKPQSIAKMKTHTTRLIIKGIQYYDAEKLIQGKRLKPDIPLRLQPEPGNKYDPYAVLVLTQENDILGHVAKETARKYQKLCFGDKIIGAKIAAIEKVEPPKKFKVSILVTYLTWDLTGKVKQIPNTSGVYEITLDTSYSYIGSTANLASRAKKHLSDLHHGIHVNKLLQADFKSPSQFEFNVLTVSQNQNEALRAEARTIQEYLAAGKLLYNKTIDGRGHASPVNSLNSISDVYKNLTKPDKDRGLSNSSDDRPELNTGNANTRESPGWQSQNAESTKPIIDGNHGQLSPTQSLNESGPPSQQSQDKSEATQTDRSLAANDEKTTIDYEQSWKWSKTTPVNKSRHKNRKSVVTWSANCSGCGNWFSVTLLADEDTAGCPKCGTENPRKRGLGNTNREHKKSTEKQKYSQDKASQATQTLKVELAVA